MWSAGRRNLHTRRTREPQKKRGMVGERNIGRQTGGGRERQPQRGRRRDRGERKINRET